LMHSSINTSPPRRSANLTFSRGANALLSEYEVDESRNDPLGPLYRSPTRASDADIHTMFSAAICINEALIFEVERQSFFQQCRTKRRGILCPSLSMCYTMMRLWASIWYQPVSYGFKIVSKNFKLLKWTSFQTNFPPSKFRPAVRLQPSKIPRRSTICDRVHSRRVKNKI
jgi:hypothetical protein